MIKADTTSVDGVSSTPLQDQRLAHLEDKLNQLLACHEFYDLAIRAITHDNFDEELGRQRWHFGLFLQQQWLHDQGQDIINNCKHFDKESTVLDCGTSLAFHLLFQTPIY